MLRRILTTTTGLAVGFGFGLASAQTLRNTNVPAEFPPASFTGKQFVDSKGCVFVRAGFDGAVTWVPRVNRKRNVLCGFSPTFAGNAAPTPPVVVEAPTPTPTPTPAPTPTVKPPVVAAAPTPTVKPPVVAATPAHPVKPPVVVVAPTPKPVRPPAPTRVAVAPPAPVRVAPVAVATRVVTACPEASVFSQRYLQSPGYIVRCGPQAAAVTARGTVPATVVRPAPVTAPPAGYRSAFDDGRFNPSRGVLTAAGDAQMRLIWTNTVPRRLIDQRTGRNVTGQYPGLRFPFIDQGQQESYVAEHGWPLPGTTSTPDVVVATKNIAPNAALVPTGRVAVGAGDRFVQVGAFAVAANAQNTVARLQALGLPVRLGTYKKRGKTYRIVLAGPFGDVAQLAAGLTAVRGAGFADAFTRK